MENKKNENNKYTNFIEKYNAYKEDRQKKNKFLNSNLSLFQEQLKHIDNFIKSINNHHKFLSAEENINKDDYIYILIKLINDSFEIMIKEDKRIIEASIADITNIVEKIKENRKYDSELEIIYNKMNQEKEKMEQEKKIFYDSITDTESNIMNQINNILDQKLQSNEPFKCDEIAKIPKTYYINYKKSIDKVNKNIEQFNNKVKYILEAIEIINNNINLLISKILNEFYENQTIKNNLTNKNKKIIKDMIIVNNNRMNNKSKDNIQIEKEYNLDFIQFENFPSKIDFLKVTDNKEFKKYVYTVELLNRNIGNIYPNISLDKEYKRNILREKIIDLFSNLDNKISNEETNEIFNELTSDVDNQRLFINELNRIRAEGKYKRNKQIINFISKTLNYIIDNLPINNKYEMAKNCIILSQTFFYENEKKEKKYIYEIIRNNKIFQNEEFWVNYTNLLVTKEFLKFQNFELKKNLDIDIFEKKNITENISNIIEELLFAQLLTTVNNMIEFKNDKKKIVKIVDAFIHKYDYMKQEKIDSIYILIGNEEEIKKIKKEISNDSMLIIENNQIENIKEEKNKILESNKEEDNKIIIELINKENGKDKENKLEELESTDNNNNKIQKLDNNEKEEENKKLESTKKNEEINKITE